MSVFTAVTDPFRRLILRTAGSLRAAVPPVAVEIGLQDVVLARVRRGRRSAILEALESRPLTAPSAEGGSSDEADLPAADVSALLRELFAASRTRPGKLSLVLPDNLAKVSVLPLPERPTSARQLAEMVRFKMRRSVPFRLDDAAIAHQLLPDDGGEAAVLVAVMQRSVLGPYERMLGDLGARPGMVGLASVHLLNLLREPLARASETADAALLNCTPAYFSFLLVRRGRLIFFRCKPYSSPDNLETTTEIMARELTTSFSYYEEKLAGRGIATAIIRTVAQPVDEVAAVLSRLGVASVEPIDLTPFVSPPEGKLLDPSRMHRAAPAIAAAVGGW